MTTRIIIPLIRKIYPTNIQPKQRLQTREEPFNAYPYIAQRHESLWNLGFNSKDLVDMTAWCQEHLSRNSWGYSCGNFFFRNEHDRLLFVMRWS